MTTRSASAPPEPLLTIAQAAERLGMTERFVRDLVRDELLPVQRFGRSVRVDPRDLEQLIRAARTKPVGGRRAHR